MSRQIPEPVRAAAGLAATVLDEALRLPRTLPGLPVRVIGLALQATMKLQQHWSGLVARGDEVLTGLRGEGEPGLATFDEDLPAATPAGRDSAFDRAAPAVPDDDEAIAEEVAALIDDEVSGLPPEEATEELVEALEDITEQVAAAEDVPAPLPGLTTEDALETALLEADGAPDAAAPAGGADAGSALVEPEEIAEAPEEFAEAPELAVGTPAAATTEDAGDAAGAGERDDVPAPSDPGGSPVGEDAGAPDVTEPEPADAGQPAPAEPTDAEPTDAAPADAEPTDTEPADAAPADAEPTDTAPADAEPTDTAPADASPAPVGPEEGGELAGAPAAGAAPIDGYDGFTIAQLRGRLRGYQLSTVQELVAYEEATRARDPFLRMLRNRLEKLERQAVESSPLAPRGA